ncbi:MAG: pirin family protein [Myxococcota bacterium]
MSIRLTIPARPHALGSLTVRRLLPASERQMIGPFIFMEVGGPTEVPRHLARGVPEHPHAGLSTFTYLMDGALRHRDSAGYSSAVYAGDIALMTSGRGISHEELPEGPTSHENQRVHFVQMWLALPDELEEMAPAFELHRAADLPEISGSGSRVRVAMGHAWGLQAPTTCHVPTVFADLFLEAGAERRIDVDHEEVAIVLLEGNAHIDGTPLASDALHVLGSRSPSLRSDTGCRALVLGGAPFPSSRFIGGSFVASTGGKLRRWMREARLGQFPRIRSALPSQPPEPV